MEGLYQAGELSDSEIQLELWELKCRLKTKHRANHRV